MDFCPEIWPEVPVPEKDENCRECGLYEHGSRMIWGEGNVLAPIMVILDNPGAREDPDGNPFVCGTRQTLQRAVHENGLTMDQIFITYVLKRRPLRGYDKEFARMTCIRHLKEQCQASSPKLILCLGNVAVQAFFHNPEIDVKSVRGKWYEAGGIPATAAYHPLAVRRRPNLLPKFMEDWAFTAKRFRSLSLNESDSFKTNKST